MFKIILTVPCLVIGSLSSHGQATILWQHALGGSGSDIAYDIAAAVADGSFVAGKTASNDGDVSGNHGGDDLWVVRLSSAGFIHWQRTLGGSSNEYALAIETTPDGGCIVAGRSNSNDGDVSGNHGGLDAWVVKLDGSGELQWQRSYGGSLSDYANDIQPTADGGYIIAGQAHSNDGDVSGGHGDIDAWVVKIDADGNIEWQGAYGGSDDDMAFAIIQTTDGGFLFVGDTWSNNGDVVDNHGLWDGWVVKLSDTGAIEWQKTMGGSAGDELRSVMQTADGGYLVTGSSLSTDGDVVGNHGANDAWVTKLQPSGAEQWKRCLGGSGYDRGYDVIQTWDGGMLLAAESSSTNGDVAGNHGGGDAWLMKCDPVGVPHWQLPMGGSLGDKAYAATRATNGGYLFAGSTRSNNGDVSGHHGNEDAWVVKFHAVEVGTNETPPPAFALSPNPSSGIVRITTLSIPSAEVTITDRLGREVLHQAFNSEEFVLDLSFVPRGMYVITMRTSHSFNSQRLILE